jgi:hypothetical protein
VELRSCLSDYRDHSLKVNSTSTSVDTAPGYGVEVEGQVTLALKSTSL